MTDPLFTPLKSHPSTWEAESKARAFAMAEDQVTIDRLRADNAVLRARVDVLEAALERISCRRVKRGWLWWQQEARAALQQEAKP